MHDEKDDNRENKGQLQQPHRTIMITMMMMTVEMYTLSDNLFRDLAALAFSLLLFA